MRQVTRLLIISLSIMPFLSGCAYLKGKKAIVKNRDMVYLQSHEIGNLQTPPDLKNASFGDELIIPPANSQNWDGKPPALLPPGSLAGDIQSGKVNPANLKQGTKQSATTDKSVTSNTVAGTLTGKSWVLNQNRNQAWSSLATVIPVAGYKVLNENKDAGVYYIADLPTTNGRMVRETAIYQLHVNEAQHQTVVTLSDNDGNPISDSTAKRVLGDLQQAAVKPKSWFSRWF